MLSFSHALRSLPDVRAENWQSGATIGGTLHKTIIFCVKYTIDTVDNRDNRDAITKITKINGK